MLNLEAFCQDNRVEYLTEGHHHAHQGWAQIHCPFCSSGSEGWHLGFNLEGGNFNCWRCGKHSPWDVVGALLNTKNGSKISEAMAKYGTGYAARKRKSITRKKAIKPPSGTEPLEKPHRKYLKKRGFDPDKLVEDWGIQGTSHLSGLWNWRIIMPISNIDGIIVAYQGRTIRKKIKPKYKLIDNTEMLEDPKKLLYGINKVPGDSVLIVEGPADVWNLGPGAVATGGIDWTTAQGNILRGFKNRFIIYDPEPKAQERAEELAKFLSYYPGNTEIIDGLDSDPGDLDGDEKKEILSLIN